MQAIRERDGVPIPDSTWQELETVALEHGVQLPN
jgi:LDH2 family malate/lactate/ureidoglycolate dehydrogenase